MIRVLLVDDQAPSATDCRHCSSTPMRASTRRNWAGDIVARLVNESERIRVVDKRSPVCREAGQEPFTGCGAGALNPVEIELVARLFSAFASGDSETIAAGLSPEIRWHSSGFDGTAGEYVGIPAGLAHLHGEDHAPQTQMRVLEILASDDRAALVACTSASDGAKSLDDDWVLLLHLVAGVVVDEAWTYKWNQRAWAAFLPAGDGRASSGGLILIALAAAPVLSRLSGAQATQHASP